MARRTTDPSPSTTAPAANALVEEAVEQQPGFAAQLRTRSWAAHGEAEGGGAMSQLMQAATRPLYEELLTQLFFVYAELEAAAEVMATDAVAGPFVVRELERRASLEADLTALRGPDWRAEATPLPETERYVQRLRDVARDRPGHFVAHHYTRYLGDLSGGLALGAAARRQLGITAADGGSFYVFSELGKPAQFKADYRALLDSAPWTAAEREEVIAEVLNAYRLNTDLQIAIARAVTPA